MFTLSPDVAWDVRVMCVLGAVFCVLLAIDLTMKAVRAFAQAVSAAAMGTLAAGTALGLLAAVTLSLV
jgi:hypothetical protein